MTKIPGTKPYDESMLNKRRLESPMKASCMINNISKLYL